MPSLRFCRTHSGFISLADHHRITPPPHRPATGSRRPHNAHTRDMLHMQDGRLPLHIAAMQQGADAEKLVKVLLKAHPEGIKERDNVSNRTPLV